MIIMGIHVFGLCLPGHPQPAFCMSSLDHLPLPQNKTPIFLFLKRSFLLHQRASCACARAVLLPAHASCPRRAVACPGVPACAPTFDAPVCPPCQRRGNSRAAAPASCASPPDPRPAPHRTAQCPLPSGAARKPSSLPCLPMPHDRSALRTGVRMRPDCDGKPRPRRCSCSRRAGAWC